MKKSKGKKAFVPRPCRLCFETRPLRRSHIFPDFYWEAIQSPIISGKNKTPRAHIHSVSTTGGLTHQVLRKEQAWELASVREWLFCHECEGKLNTYETYARKYFYLHQQGAIRRLRCHATSVSGLHVSTLDPSAHWLRQSATV
jgi:hypothetical protein